MAASRIDMLRTFIAQQPGQAFPRYALAQELKNAGDLAGAWTEFETLLGENPDYVAGYYHGGQTLVALSRREEARDVFTRGLAQCTRKGDMKTGHEIEAALAAL